MGVKALLGAMVVGSALILGLGRRRASEPPPPAPPHHVAEDPWLSRDAAAQLIGDDGGPGPLFAGAILGGPAPTAETRATIAEFARKNRMHIELETQGGDLTAIRFEVSFSGCCGYEGADVLALRLQRPSTGRCCVCGPDDKWIDDWAIAIDIAYARARVRVNKVSVRWEPVATPDDLVARAEALLGKTVADVEKRAGDRFSALAWQSYRLEAAFAYPNERREGLAMQIATDHGKVVEVSLPLPDDAVDAYADAMRARWGRPHATAGGKTWRRGGKTITLDESALTFRGV